MYHQIYIYMVPVRVNIYIYIYIQLHWGVVRYWTFFFCGLRKQEQVMPFKGQLVGFRILHLEDHIVIVHELLYM